MAIIPDIVSEAVTRAPMEAGTPAKTVGELHGMTSDEKYHAAEKVKEAVTVYV